MDLWDKYNRSKPPLVTHGSQYPLSSSKRMKGPIWGIITGYDEAENAFLFRLPDLYAYKLRNSVVREKAKDTIPFLRKMTATV